MEQKSNLLHLFSRPLEPVFVPKGEDSVSFDVPADFLAPRFQSMGTSLLDKFGERSQDRIKLRDPKTAPMDEVAQLPRNEPFSLFLPDHQRWAGLLVDVFMDARTLDEFLGVATYARDRINPYLYNYALSVAILHRDDTRDLPLPSMVATFPGKFIVASEFGKIEEEAAIVPIESRAQIELTEATADADLEAEQRVAYFREDIAINLHHWHWHLVHPMNGRSSIAGKDRRGELFYYMHQQMLARYNVERLCNGMNFVAPLTVLTEPIEEGYFSKLRDSVASRYYPGRPPHSVLRDVHRRRSAIVTIAQLNAWKQNLFEAINQGYAVDRSGTRVPLDETNGIDILGNMVESSSSMSPNFARYGSYHNMGHVIIAFVHDPDERFLESLGVMGDTATAMRDPVFYRWHVNVDNIFQAHKMTLTPYTEKQLYFHDIVVKQVEVVGRSGSKNRFQTFWQKSSADLSHGLNFQKSSAPLYVKFVHLNHEPFTYRIQLENKGATRKEGTCRIFLAPKFNDAGRPMMFDEQRTLMMEMDKFAVALKPGLNEIQRTSEQSSVTIPFEVTFSDLNMYRSKAGQAVNFCGCGWPQHMLVPKGSVDGFAVQLFVMVTDFEGDRVDQDLEGVCSNAVSYCGIRNRKYPDRKPMGYPFDRRARTGVDTLQQFLTPNMHVLDLKIYNKPSEKFKVCLHRDPNNQTSQSMDDCELVFN